MAKTPLAHAQPAPRLLDKSLTIKTDPEKEKIPTAKAQTRNETNEPRESF
jgi:hypothetical protein